MNAEVRDWWDRAVRALETADVGRRKWSVELGAAFSFLASLRRTADYGGASHVVPEEAHEAVEKAKAILEVVQKSHPESLGN